MVVHRAQGNADIIKKYLARLDRQIALKDQHEKAVIDELNHGQITKTLPPKLIRCRRRSLVQVEYKPINRLPF